MNIAISLYLIKGMAVGIEMVDLPDTSFLVIDLAIVRVMIEFLSND
jgi:hypothetical protein